MFHNLPSALTQTPKSGTRLPVARLGPKAESRRESSSSLLAPPSALASARLLYATAAASGHDWLGHAECAARVPAILSALRDHQGLASHPGVVELEGFAPATLEHVRSVHDRRLIAALERMSDSAADVAGLVIEPSPTYVTQTSYRDAFKAMGAVVALVDHVVAASQQNQLEASSSGTAAAPGPAGFAICRPPGHHAVPQGSMGFCLLNNVAVAARHAQQRHHLQRVAIFDYDVHHGNGTQDCFYCDPSVLFISTHQSGIYPGSGQAGEAGMDEGEGFTLNIPLPGEAGHEAAVAVLEEVVEPALRRFGPDIILVSAGFDAHYADPLGGLQYRSSTYHFLASRMRALAGELCGGRLVFLLEGGYNLSALGESVANTFCGVLGAPAFDPVTHPKMLREEPLERVRAAIAEAQRIHGI